MARTSRGFWRLCGAAQSRRIPAHAHCPICERQGIIETRPCVYVVLSTAGRNYACREHGEQARTLGYEVFEGQQD